MTKDFNDAQLEQLVMMMVPKVPPSLTLLTGSDPCCNYLALNMLHLILCHATAHYPVIYLIPSYPLYSHPTRLRTTLWYFIVLPNSHTSPQVTRPNQRIMTQGEEGNCIYIIEKGKFHSWTWNSKPQVVRSFEPLGEHAFIYACPRVMSLESKSNGSYPLLPTIHACARKLPHPILNPLPVLSPCTPILVLIFSVSCTS